MQHRLGRHAVVIGGSLTGLMTARVLADHFDAAAQPHLEAGAQRTLSGVGCSRLILIEAPSPADQRGMLRVAKTLGTNTEETSMRFYTKQPPLSCGIALHARTMYVCLLDQAGETL